MGDQKSIVPFASGGRVAAIVPHNFEEAWRLAGALSASGMTPKEINTQEKVLAIILAGAEVGMPPFQALQSFAIINGRPSIWGDGMMALVRARGVRIEERIDGEGDNAIAICKITRPDTKEEIERRFSMKDAKKAGLAGKAGPWTSYPTRMLQMRARSWAVRDGCADMLRGISMAEEMQDVVQATILEEASPPENGFIRGAEKRELVDDLDKQIAATENLQTLDELWDFVCGKYKSRLSDNVWSGLEELHERRKHALEEAAFKADRAVNDVTLPTEPAPKSLKYNLLLSNLLDCETPEQIAAWMDAMPALSAGMVEPELAELRAEYAAKRADVRGG